jgi:hypothetical protein
MEETNSPSVAHVGYEKKFFAAKLFFVRREQTKLADRI